MNEQTEKTILAASIEGAKYDESARNIRAENPVTDKE